ncbi:MAG: uL30 family ribosomal protein [Nanoarchaeota archaeon]|nr:uL30 family ribosomal protein [Thermodesulfovibrionia bacterium]MCK5282737.1 uL30 family ribosomal protein [Nanoarchaeota archaeon]
MKIAVIRVRGSVRIKKEIIDTLNMLRLYNKNYCVVLNPTPQNIGMVNKVKDFVTYGEVEEGLFKELIGKRGEEYKGREKDSKGKIEYKRKYFEFDGKKYNKYFRLPPPRKGYERKGIKKPFSRGGALGNRREKINDLIRRMI